MHILIRQIPNILTYGRCVLTIVFLGMLLYWPRVETNPAFFLDIAFVIFVVAGITDMIDGTVARALKVTSKMGRMMDPLADKLLVCGAFICFAIIEEPKLFDFSEITMHIIRWGTAAILIAREVYVTTLRHIAEAKGVDFAATASGKVKMFLQSFGIGTVVIKAAHVQTAAWGYWFTSVVYLLMIVSTVYSGIRATRRKSWQQLQHQQA